LGDKHADAAEKISMDQLPQVDHFTPIILGERNGTNAWNMFLR
jgi:hypothetical protein